jgi:hypothetical protein
MSVQKITLRNFLLLSLLFQLVETSYGQYSYDFAIPLPPEGIKSTTVSKQYFGIYSSDAIDIDYEFSTAGIFANSTIYSSISREAIRESSKYRVEDNFLFGVKENDSIPCILDGEFYYFGIKYREQIVGGDSKNIFSKISETAYILNFEDKGHFTPSLFEFNKKELCIRHFTYEESADTFKEILLRTEKPSSDFNSITLNPTNTEWDAISFDSILGEKSLFKR